MEKCRLCELEIGVAVWESARVPGVCTSCADTILITAMPPPRRRPAPCQRCNGMRFVRAIPREYSGEYDYPDRMTVTQPPHVARRMMFAGNTVSRARPGEGKGSLETYVCLGCGFVEWYCHDPETIPIGPEHMTDLVDYNSDAPYR